MASMASYQERADQAISDQRWQDAEHLLTSGIADTAFLDTYYRMQLRRLALPLYREAVHLEGRRREANLTDSLVSEVCEGTVTLLHSCRREYTEQYNNNRYVLYTKVQREHIGILAELSIFGFWIHAREQQADKGLLVPALSHEDREGGRKAYDFGMYHPAMRWHKAPKTLVQVKHLRTENDSEKYDPEVVIVAYQGDSPFGLDKNGVTSSDSASAKLARKGSGRTNPTDERYLIRKYTRFFNLARDWPAFQQKP